MIILAWIILGTFITVITCGCWIGCYICRLIASIIGASIITGLVVWSIGTLGDYYFK